MSEEKLKVRLSNGKLNPKYWKNYNQTEGAKASREKYSKSDKGKTARKESVRRQKNRFSKKNPSAYADRIMKDLEARGVTDLY